MHGVKEGKIAPAMDVYYLFLSMGHGNYLISEHTGIRMKHGAYDGRREVETKFEICFDTYAKDMHPYKNYTSAELLPSPNETDQAFQGADVTMKFNDEKQGVELKFTEKPSEEMIASLRIAGFRWSRPKRIWYAKQNERTIAFAKRICRNEDIPNGEIGKTPADEPLNNVDVEETVERTGAINSSDEESATAAANAQNALPAGLTDIASQTPATTDQLAMF